MDHLPAYRNESPMTQQLGMRQRNNLLVGNRLAAEITATSESRRAFLVVTPYREDDTPQYDSLGRRKRKRFSKFLDADHTDVRFSILVFDVDITALAMYMEEGGRSWDATIQKDKLASYSGIVSIESLEEGLRNQLSDLSRLGVDWRVLPWWD